MKSENDDLIKFYEDNETNQQIEFIRNQNATINVAKLQNFLARMNADPPAALVKINKFANNTKYLPISYLEMLLDQISLGIWETKNFHYEILTNELVGSIIVKFYHPVIGNFIERVGVAAVQIQTKSGTDPYDITNKIPNTLVKQVGQLKAECFRNAVKSIGKIFGRDLNRDDAAEFNPTYYEDNMKIEITRQTLIEAKQSIRNNVKSNNAFGGF